MGWGYYAPYVSVGEKREKAEKQLEKLRKKGERVQPVIIEGKKIAQTWWGKAWCENLERYADYEYRVGRGRSYVKDGFVLDLDITEGVITAQVMGSSLYKITIKIDKMPEVKWRVLADICAKRVDSVAALAEGKFPEELAEVFMRQGSGLFPSPKEIHLKCSCPDYASMCKHVAAALYGVGARLDDDPLLFFTLRGIDPTELIRKSVDEKMSALLKNAGTKSKRVISEEATARIFGDLL